MWRKGAVAEGEAGSLVRMAEGQAVTYKIAKKLDDLQPVESLPALLAEVLGLRAGGE